MLLPVPLQFLAMGELDAAHLHGDLKAVAMEVVVVLETARYVVPGCAVRNAVREVIIMTTNTKVHGWMGEAVRTGELLEGGVVR